MYGTIILIATGVTDDVRVGLEEDDSDNLWWHCGPGYKLDFGGKDPQPIIYIFYFIEFEKDRIIRNK